MQFGESKNFSNIEKSGDKIIKRTPILLDWSVDQIIEWVLSYYNILKKATIPIPKILDIYDSSSNNIKLLTIVTEYKGTALKIEEHLDKFFPIVF